MTGEEETAFAKEREEIGEWGQQKGQRSVRHNREERFGRGSRTIRGVGRRKKGREK